MAVDADGPSFDVKCVFSIQSRPSSSLHILAGKTDGLTVPRPTIGRRSTLLLLGRSWLRTTIRLSFRQLVVTLNASSLKTVTLASVPSSGTPAAEAMRFTGLHVARFVLGVANVRSGSTVATGNIAGRQSSPTTYRTL